MPSFQDALEKEPETIWNLVAYVLDLADTPPQGHDSGGGAPQAPARRREAAAAAEAAGAAASGARVSVPQRADVRACARRVRVREVNV